MIYTCGIVEDEPLAERMLQKYISRIGFFKLSWTCAFAAEAAQLMRTSPVHLLFLDLQEAHPRPDSALLHLLRNYGQRIIVTSPYPYEAVYTELGIVAFLTKPVSFKRFLEATESFLEMQEN